MVYYISNQPNKSSCRKDGFMYKKLLIATVIGAVSLGCMGCGEKTSEDDLLIATSAQEVITETDIEDDDITEAAEETQEVNRDADQTEEKQNADDKQAEDDVYQQALASVVETNSKAETIEDTMKNDDTLNQTQLNEKAEELYKVWDDELNALWKVLNANLDEETMKTLKAEQRAWINKKESKADEAAADVKGGSMEPMVYNTSAAGSTKERVYELVEYLK